MSRSYIAGVLGVGALALALLLFEAPKMALYFFVLAQVEEIFFESLSTIAHVLANFLRQ